MEETKEESVFYTSRLLEEQPHARFVFKYKPKEFLRALGVIPVFEKQAASEEMLSNFTKPPPTNLKLKRKRSWATDIEDKKEDIKAREIRRMEQQMQELQQRIHLLNRDEECTSLHVKREIKRELINSLSVDDNGVIDLTDG